MKIDKKFFDRYSIDIKELIPQITDSIVTVVGEKYRKLVMQRLQQIQYISAYVNYQDVANDYVFRKRLILRKLEWKFLEKMGIEVSEETRYKVMIDGSEAYEEKQKKELETFFGKPEYDSYGIIYQLDQNGSVDYSQHGIYGARLVNRCAGKVVNLSKFKDTEEGKCIIEKIKRAYIVAGELFDELKEFVEQNREVLEFCDNCRKIQWDINSYAKKNNLTEEEIREKQLRQLSNYYEEAQKIEKIKKVNCESTVISDMKKDNTLNYTEDNIIIIPILRWKECKDVALIHEILHSVLVAIEVELNGKEGTLLAENIHERFSKEVTEIMHKKGVYLLDDPCFCKIHDTTMYEEADPIVEPFMEKFGERIRQSIMDEDLMRDFKFEIAGLGKENLIDLAKLINEYYDFLESQHDENEKGKKINYYIEKVREIVENMTTHSLSCEGKKSFTKIMREAMEAVPPPVEANRGKNGEEK